MLLVPYKYTITEHAAQAEVYLVNYGGKLKFKRSLTKKFPSNK